MNWPTVDELKARLDITSNDWDDQLARLIQACIDETKAKVGDWDEAVDQPDEALAQSALELAVERGMTGESAPAVGSRSGSLLYGHRRRWGTA